MDDIIWKKLLYTLRDIIGIRPKDLNAVLFLIGVQEVGQGNIVYTKEQKQDLMHVATCTLLALDGHYKKTEVDDEGWPQFELISKTPHLKLFEQENLMKTLVIQYFQNMGIEFA